MPTLVHLYLDTSMLRVELPAILTGEIALLITQSRSHWVHACRRHPSRDLHDLLPTTEEQENRKQRCSSQDFVCCQHSVIRITTGARHIGPAGFLLERSARDRQDVVSCQPSLTPVWPLHAFVLSPSLTLIASESCYFCSVYIERTISVHCSTLLSFTQAPLAAPY
ncbi:hypothetical protein CBL_11812 [Carabus blaptoides fortunei]